MCGILNVISKDGRLDLPACSRALSGMTWRGPDLCSYTVWENRVFLGQTVLSFTGDISDKKGTYLISSSGRFIISFNGEIYNYHDLANRWFRDKPAFTATHCTDTEILANLHEALDSKAVISELDGMFAYTALDKKKRTLNLCRDVQGEKSLYVYEDSHWIIISSEIGPILSLVGGIQLDAQALRDYFHTRHLMLFSRTIYRGIRQLLPGHLESLNLETWQWSLLHARRLQDWIDPGLIESNGRRSLDSLADELDALLARCVKQMIPNDRRYAAVVSGGVDSSLAAYYVTRYGNPDLLVAVNHMGKDRISSDLSGFERALQRPIEVLHVDHVSYSAELVRCQHMCASPLLSHSFVAQSIQSALVRSKGCRALFGGDGGDEIFGGYPCYHGKYLPNGRFSPSPYMAFNVSEVGFMENNLEPLQQELSEAWEESLLAYQCIKSPEERAGLAMMLGDAACQLPAVALRGTDLMSMMWSVETRCVYLRHPIVRFAINLPYFAKVNRNSSILDVKVLMKILFLRYYGQSLLYEKQGFAGFPNESASFLGNPQHYLVYDILGILKESCGQDRLSQTARWKLTNVEYFLRSGRHTPIPSRAMDKLEVSSAA